MFTSVFFHGSVLHLAFNMMAFVPMASSLERLLGTVQFTHLVLVFTTLASCYHVLAAWGATHLLGYPSMYECAIGLSGVIFGEEGGDTTDGREGARAPGSRRSRRRWHPTDYTSFAL